jgi:hypothetical protein
VERVGTAPPRAQHGREGIGIANKLSTDDAESTNRVCGSVFAFILKVSHALISVGVLAGFRKP